MFAAALHGRRRMWVAVLGLAVLIGVGGIAFFAGRTDSRPDSPDRGSPAAPVVAAPALPSVPPPPTAPAAVKAPAPVPPPVLHQEPPAPPAAAPGFLVVKAQPWGRLFVDDKFIGNVEGSRKVPLAPGSHTVRLLNGKKAWPSKVEIEPGKTVTREHNFLEE
jgi:hypothetical protein